MPRSVFLVPAFIVAYSYLSMSTTALSTSKNSDASLGLWIYGLVPSEGTGDEGKLDMSILNNEIALKANLISTKLPSLFAPFAITV